MSDLKRKIPVLPEELEELQECREVDNGVAESTGGTTGRRISRSEGMKVEVDNGAVKSSIDVWSDSGTGRGIQGDGSQRDDTDGYMERLELPEDRWSTMVTSGISVGDIPERCRVDGNRQWRRCRNRITGVSMN